MYIAAPVSTGHINYYYHSYHSYYYHYHSLFFDRRNFDQNKEYVASRKKQLSCSDWLLEINLCTSVLPNTCACDLLFKKVGHAKVPSHGGVSRIVLACGEC